MDMEACSPETKDSFRKPANEVSRRNYRRHSPSSSRSPSPPSPGGWKRDRSPARAIQEDGGSKRERRFDTESEGVRGDTGSNRKSLDDYRNSSRRSDDYDHGYNRRHTSHYDRSYHSTRDSRADSYRHDDGRYSKRSPERGVRERGAEESRYRRKENHINERDRERHDRSDVRDRYKTKDHETHLGRNKTGGKRVDEASDVDLERSRYGKKVENSGMGDDNEGKGRNLENMERDNCKKELESRRKGRDEEKASDNHYRDKDTQYKELGERHGKKSDTTMRKNNESPPSRHEATEHLKERTIQGKDSTKKEERDKRSELPKANSARFGLASESFTVQGLSSGTDNLDESKKFSSTMDEKLAKGSKWGPESGSSDGAMVTPDPEAARLAALKAAQQVSINLGGFKSVDEKKKMLWKSKAQEPAAVTGTIRWDTVEFADGDRREKFKKLMSLSVLYISPTVGCERGRNHRRRNQGWRWRIWSICAGETARTATRSREAIHRRSEKKGWANSWIRVIMYNGSFDSVDGNGKISVWITMLCFFAQLHLAGFVILFLYCINTSVLLFFEEHFYYSLILKFGVGR